MILSVLSIAFMANAREAGQRKQTFLGSVVSLKSGENAGEKEKETTQEGAGELTVSADVVANKRKRLEEKNTRVVRLMKEWMKNSTKTKGGLIFPVKEFEVKGKEFNVGFYVRTEKGGKNDSFPFDNQPDDSDKTYKLINLESPVFREETYNIEMAREFNNPTIVGDYRFGLRGEYPEDILERGFFFIMETGDKEKTAQSFAVATRTEDGQEPDELNALRTAEAFKKRGFATLLYMLQVAWFKEKSGDEKAIEVFNVGGIPNLKAFTWAALVTGQKTCVYISKDPDSADQSYTEQEKQILQEEYIKSETLLTQLENNLHPEFWSKRMFFKFFVSCYSLSTERERVKCEHFDITEKDLKILP